MTVYQSSIDTAERLIREKGRELTYIRNLDVAPTSRATDLPADLDEATSTIRGVVLPMSTMTEQSYGGQFAKGSMALQKARRILVAGKALAFTPRENDQLFFDDATWNLIGITETAPDGTPILYEFIVKK